MTHIVHQYAEQVMAGEISAGPHVRNQCRRHLADLKRKDIHFDETAADRAIGFFHNVLKLSEGQFEGVPFVLHISQAFIVGSIFGWKKPDGFRRFRRCYIEMGKGNGKSPLAGGIGLYGLMADGEAGAQIYAAAAKKEQAMILFQDAVKMVRQSPALEKRITPSGVNPVWNLAYISAGSFFRPISRDSGKSGSGPRPHFALCDEVHEHPDRGIMEMLERGFKFRNQPLMLMITNSGSDRNSVCWEEHQHACAVAAGDVQDDTTFAYVCALDEGDDPLNDPSCWSKVNPLLGIILKESYLQGVVDQAKAIPGKMNSILRLHFCVWTDADAAWISRKAWEMCEDPSMTLDDFAEKPCFIGLDLSATKDITGVAYVFPDGQTEDGRPKFALFARGYTPADTVDQREMMDKAPYSVWVRDGWLIAPPGKVIRYDHLAYDIVDAAAKFDVQAVSYDRWLIKTFENALDEIGGVLPLIEHPQGTNQRKDTPLWMPQSVNQFEDLILEKRIRIEINPALRSAVASACFWTSPAGLRRFEKQRATGRIDMALAATMAIGAAMGGEATKPPTSPWDDPTFTLGA
ncbi:COG4626 Phage terminase-like protein, large subunit [uncultured Caudovirales phage]|uniref:COG4626 Phage terminase-like protein, large subunit n=1 Tax=uncultured Caudovirales phage TaxID=2100421 RepID=A0A6J5MWL1_9CAUD|nr:COG4626 Phage terminase-like protein, large subunit [uncultured Caudovirales phage]